MGRDGNLRGGQRGRRELTFLIKGLRALLFSAFAVALAALCLHLHLNLSSAGLIELLFVLLVSLVDGFAPSTLVSVVAFLCLNYWFTDPLFTFSVSDPQDWVALFTFELSALLVSWLSQRLKLQAVLTEEQRERAVSLYELSRAVLLIDRRAGTGDQLSAMIRRILKVDDVQIWTEHETFDASASPSSRSARQQAYETYLQNRDLDDPAACCSRRVLRFGARAIGGMAMHGWSVDPLLADAVASIAAITFERAYATQKESRAEAERDAELLRGAVLDGLAHGFKTPLTAIQTASSGLLAIDGLSPTQWELVSIIDERAAMLGGLTTRLLQTAALEASKLQVTRSKGAVADAIRNVVETQGREVRERMDVDLPSETAPDHFDQPLVELAIEQLVDNAARYSAAGSRVSLRLAQLTAETRITVENTTFGGTAIRSEERDRIFDRFYRGHDAVHGPSGTGLGLSIVRKIADAHGGRAWAECSEETTRFHISLPRFAKENL